MAIYHCSIKIISRGKGKSAVAAAAYRSGEIITNEYDGITHDYTRKGGIVHTEILLPQNTPNEYSERAVLWNAVEKIEKSKNSQLAREVELALPAELTREQNISLVREYVSGHFISAGMCADICIHDKNDGNPHAHVLLTMRPFEQSGEWGAKSRKEYVLDKNGERIRLKSGEFKTNKINTVDWNEQTKAEEWRAAWAQSVNTVLEKYNIESRVDHRSYKRQGVEQIPTVHMGVAASQMERKGIATERGNQNREVIAKNSLLRQLIAKVKQLKDWLKETISPTPDKTKTEKPSIIAQLNNYKKENWEIEKLDSPKPALNDLYVLLDKALQKVKAYDMRKRSAKDLGEWDSLTSERRKAYNEYSAVKQEVKKAEKQAGNQHLTQNKNNNFER